MSAYCDSIPTFFVTGQVGMFHNKKGKLDKEISRRDVKSHMNLLQNTQYCR